MRPYLSYKDSGVEWIGEIPQSWIKSKVKYLVDNSKYYQIGDGDHGSIKPEMYQEEGIPYIRVQNLSWNGELLKDGLVFISKEVHNNNLKSKLLPNDLLICKTGNTIGKIGVLTDEFGESNTTSSVGKVSIDKRDNSVSFFKYVFQSDIIQKQINIIGKEKSCQPGFNIDHLIDFIVIKPPLPEQKQIVSFLDHKTRKIDELIEKTEQKIELLKEKRTSLINHCVTKGLNPNVEMKDSGIEWIGDIPSGWGLIQLKYLTSKVGSGVTPRGGSDVYIDEGIPFLRSQNIHFSRLVLDDVVYISQEIHDQMSSSKVVPNDVLFNITGGSIGRCFYTKPNSIEYNVNQHVCIIRPNEKILTKFLYYCLYSNLGQIQVSLNNTGSGKEGLNFQNIKGFILTNVNKNEQQQIVEYLDAKTQEIDSTIEKEIQRIELLKEYRQSLISEVVSGKIDVRDYVKENYLETTP